MHIRVALFNATSENDLRLLEENGDHLVSFANRTGTNREVLRMLFLPGMTCSIGRETLA